MGSHKTISASSYPIPTVPVPPPVADYNVTETITPNANCNYFLAGVYGGKSYYRRVDGIYFIWWSTGAVGWVISVNPSSLFGPYWVRYSPDIVGIYENRNGAEELARVSAGPH